MTGFETLSAWFTGISGVAAVASFVLAWWSFHSASGSTAAKRRAEAEEARARQNAESAQRQAASAMELVESARAEAAAAMERNRQLEALVTVARGDRFTVAAVAKDSYRLTNRFEAVTITDVDHAGGHKPFETPIRLEASQTIEAFVVIPWGWAPVTEFVLHLEGLDQPVRVPLPPAPGSPA